MQRYFLEFSYNGKPYHGWQKQPNAPSVQEEMEKALSILCRTLVDTLGAGRTDTGVHARQMFLHMDLPFQIEQRDQFIYKLNKMLASSISVKNIFLVPSTAHARFDATSRTYEYQVHTYKDPFLADGSLFLYGSIDFELMNQAAKMLLGTQDFECFSKTHTDVKTTICTITKAEWINYGQHKWMFKISANRFLRNMVRAITGTLLEVGRHKISLTEFKEVLESKSRSEAGQSVPAHALYLTRVEYPQNLIIHE